MVDKQEEYKLANDQTISIQRNGDQWEVACWNKDDSQHWYKEFVYETDARTEFEKWRK